VSFKSTIEKIRSLPVIAESVAIAGAFVFLIQALRFAHIQESILDEGLYLVKGILFAGGRYTPFQFDGPWTNQMPLSYYIPGFVQMIFSNGLRTGRYFSVALGVLILLGLWILARRLAGRWWATGIVWMVAINPAFANGYSMAVSQGLVACILTWTLVLAVNERARLWQLVLAATLAGMLILVRVNMAPVLLFLSAYIFWQFGWRKGIWAALAGAAVVVVGHALYWPEILQNWARWIPASMAPFLNPWRIETLGIEVWDPSPSIQDRLASLWDGIRFNFIPILALGFFGILSFHRQYWTNSFHYRTAVLISVTTTALTLAHAWAALLQSYCVFCFSGYLAFFSPVIVLLIALVYKSWRPGRARLYSLSVLIITLVLFTGAGYGASREIGPGLLELSIPRLSAGKLQSGYIPLWGLLQNGFGIEYKTARWLVPTLAGFTVAMLLIGLAWLAWRKKWFPHDPLTNFGLLLAGLALALGLMLTPTPVLTQLEQGVSCQGDVIAAMEQAGEHLAKYIPPDALVYWQGSLSAVPLLSIPEARIFPAQLNDGYTYRIGGDTQALRKFGLWNEVLKEKWLGEADLIIVQERYYDQEWKQFLESGQFNELPVSPKTDPCAENSALRIFRRIQ
jgi:hypothetical protein